MKIRQVISLALCLYTAQAAALQIIEPVEGQNSFAKISAQETTRIVIDGGKIKSMIATDGEIAVEKDEERGQVFIRPLILEKPINIRLITASGATHNLVLQPVDVPQEDIVIRESDKMNGQSAAKPVATDSVSSDEALLRNLFLAMASDEPVPGVYVKQTPKEYLLWENTQFVRTATYKWQYLNGEKYRLTNTGKEEMRVVEPEFYTAGVKAIAIRNMTIKPGQSTDIYIIRGE